MRISNLFIGFVFAKIRLFILFFICSILFSSVVHGQTDSTSIKKKRFYGVVSAELTAHGASLIGLDNAWYKGYPQSDFHFFNDNSEWLQMDKCGHVTTSYYIGKIGYNLLKWSNVDDKRAVWYGGGMGWIYMLSIEILDGNSQKWGFSMGDFTANTIGAALFMSQQLKWRTQRISLKWSYTPSIYAEYRPDLYGDKLTESWIKDYNGQTYWLSFNIASFLPQKSKFPKCLNLALGYGADGMIGGRSNPLTYNDAAMPYFDRSRQFYLSADLDLTKIRTRSKVLKVVFNTFGFLKIPSPTLEFHSKNGFVLHGLFF
ncbi:MAG: DUF2279 domain-containing protein [Bacteroidetes bacterium]|nr:DUF2279 domain-containing protein [Bacteroidota bacterium]